MLRNRLTKLVRHRSKLAKKAGITAYCIYDKDLPEFPVRIDWYDGRVYMSEYKAKHRLTEAQHAAWLQGTLQVIADVLQVPEENIYTKERRRKADRFSQYQKTGSEAAFFTVQESGLQFWVNLSDYLDTGLFLDHRITRQMVRQEAAGRRVLNLFAYTGSFSVYAAAGGASEVVTVDLSNTYINWAKRNFALNGFTDERKYHFVVADVLQYLKSLPAGRFDLIIMDPPTFSNSKKMKDILDIQRDHAELINRCMHALQPGGVLYFSTNARRFQLNRAALTATECTDITRATTPFDFEGKLLRWCWKMVK